MRRVSDITIQVEDRLAPPRPVAPPRPADGRAKAARQQLRRRWTPPYWLKKSKRAATALCLATLVAVGGMWLVHSAAGQQLGEDMRREAVALSARAGFRVAEILVEGRTRTPRGELLAALKVERGDPIFGIDLSATRQRLEELSWVKTATIERRLPNEIHLLITERAPIVIWQNEGHYYLVDRDGQIVGDEIDQYRDLPLMVGEGAPDHAAALLDLLRTEPVLQKRVKAAQWVGDRRWNITFDRTDSGIELRLPEDDPLSAWHELAQLEHDHSLLERQVTVVDMRLPDRLVVRTTPGAGQNSTAAGHGRHKQQPGKDA